MKEQSSTSNQNLPKHKPALEEKYKKQEENLPKPTGWRLLVLPFKMKDKTKGGIVLAESTIERQQVASQCGLVLEMGPQCYKDKERYPTGPWCKKGDWVMFAQGSSNNIISNPSVGHSQVSTLSNSFFSK